MMGTPGAGMDAMGGMMGMMDAIRMVQALCNAAGPFDQAFLQMMIPHHQSAVMMARVALLRATHPEFETARSGDRRRAAARDRPDARVARGLVRAPAEATATGSPSPEVVA